MYNKTIEFVFVQSEKKNRIEFKDNIAECINVKKGN